MKKQVIKVKRPKRRIPVAPPGSRHKSDKDYDRKKEKKQVKEEIDDETGRPKDFQYRPGCICRDCVLY